VQLLLGRLVEYKMKDGGGVINTNYNPIYYTNINPIYIYEVRF